MDEKLKRLLQKDMEREADHIMEVLDMQPDKDKEDLSKAEYEDVLARLQEFAAAEAKFEAERKAEEEARVAAREAGDNSHLSSEEQELMRLGVIYKKRKKWNRLAILVAALVCLLTLGLSATGGPDKLFEEVKRMMSGREQTRINTDSDRIEAVEEISEVEAYEKIEQEFGFYPVKLNYLPSGIELSETDFNEAIQKIQLIYEDGNGGTISYIMRPNYRTGSLGTDIEDELIKEYDMDIEGNLVHVKQYRVEENRIKRWAVEFEYQNVQYLLRITGLDDNEYKKIVENLFFS